MATAEPALAKAQPRTAWTRPIFAFLASWSFGAVVLMLYDYINDPYNPALEGTARYGHNARGAIFWHLGAIAVELGFLQLILRPWTYRAATWYRAAIALLIWVPWAVVSVVWTMHAGGVAIIHGLGAVLVTLFLGVLLIASVALKTLQR